MFKEKLARYRRLSAISNERCDRAEAEYDTYCDNGGQPDANAFLKIRKEIADDAATAQIDASIELDAITETMRAIPAKTVAGLIAKARTLPFDLCLLPPDDGPQKDWDAPYDFMKVFMDELERFATTASLAQTEA